MLKRIIFLLKNCEKADCQALLPASTEYELPSDTDGALVFTDDEEILSDVSKKGFAAVFCTAKDGFVSGAEYVVQSADVFDYEYADAAYRRMHGLPLTLFETQRTTVRELCIGDLPKLYEIYDDDEVRKYIEPLKNYEQEKESLESYIRNMYGMFGFGLWAVVERQSQKLIGRAGISYREIGGAVQAELGYLIAGEYRHKGYAYEVCSAIMDYAFGELGFESLCIVTSPDNIASVKTARKLGFGNPELLILQGCEYTVFKYCKAPKNCAENPVK